MKNLITILSALFLINTAFSQAPQKMTYQSVIRNGAGGLVANSPVGIRIQILQGSQFGAAVYVETHTATTNINGLATIEIGSGIPVLGTLSGINWTAGPYFLKTETDPTGGTSYSIVGVNEMLSVPYALYAKTAGTKIGFFANQTVGSFQPIGSAYTTIQFNAKDFDDGNNFNTGTGEYTIPENGVYHFDAVIDFYYGSGTTTQMVLFGVSVNGNPKYFSKLFSRNVGDNASGIMTVNLKLNVGDIVKLIAGKLATGNVDACGSGNGGNYFTGYKVY